MRCDDASVRHLIHAGALARRVVFDKNGKPFKRFQALLALSRHRAEAPV